MGPASGRLRAANPRPLLRAVMRCLRYLQAFFALACFAAAQMPAPTPAEEPVLIGAAVTETDGNTGEALLRGNARVRQGNVLLTAMEMRWNQRAGSVTAKGDVVLMRGPLRLLADSLTYRTTDGTFSAERVRVGSYPFYAEGASANGTRDEVTITQARISYGEPGPFQPTVTADTATLSPGRQVRSDNARLGVGGTQFLPFPKFQQNLSTPLLPFASVAAGYRSSLGVFLETGLTLPVALGIRFGGDLGLYSKRGVMAGPAAVYNAGTDGLGYRGYLRSGYIKDNGNRLTDVLGRPVPQERAFVEWQHQQKFAEHLTLQAQANWWKDSEVVRDFRPRAFFPVQEPDTFLEAARTGPNYFLSLFARFQPNSFHRVQERLPEVRFDLLPIALPGGFVERFNASAAVLREDPLPAGPLAPPSTPLLRSDRLDVYYALERPISPAEWLAITPMVGGRVTHYANTRGAVRDGNYTRWLGEVGFDAALRTSGTFDYRNERWDINGLRHLFTPRLSYRYVPRGDSGRGRIPRIDRRDLVSTYLQPLGLGDTRNIDDLQATNTLRVGLDNTVQTRDRVYGSRDLLVFNLAADLRYRRLRGDRDVSAVHMEIALTPVPWLRVDVYQSFTPQDFRLHEFNSAVVINDGAFWSLRFSNNFLRRELHDYAVEGRARLNEAFELLTRLRYDVRQRRFNEQAYGVVQNLGNTWQLSYTVSLFSGNRRESNFGFNVHLDALRF